MRSEFRPQLSSNRGGLALTWGCAGYVGSGIRPLRADEYAESWTPLTDGVQLSL